MKLFDEVRRTISGPGPRSAPLFRYYNRSNRQDIARVRTVFEDWFSRYPSPHKRELRDRLRRSERSAFFELLLHEVLIRLGCHARVHPRLRQVESRPEFLVGTSHGTRFYLEAVTTGQSVENPTRRQLKDWLYDEIDRRLQSSDFQVSVHLICTGRNRPPVTTLVSSIEQYLQGLDPTEVTSPLQAEDIQPLRWECNGWVLEVSPSPKSQALKGRGQTLPIAVTCEGAAPDDLRPIWNAVHDKASKYGRIRLPYVVAINLASPFLPSYEDVRTALFGEESAARDDRQVAPHIKHRPLFGSESEPRNTRVSAVLAVRLREPANVSGAPACVWHNPWGAKPCPLPLTVLPQVRLEGNALRYIAGKSLGDVLGLRPDWPMG